jgi:RDD family
MERHDVALSLRRVMANAIDLLIGLVLGVVLSNTVVGFFFAGRAVVMLRIGAAGTIWKGPIPMILGILGPLVYGLPFAILLVLLTEPLIGTSPGKALLGLTIVPCDGGILARRQLWRRAIIKATPFWGLTAALLAGSWMLALVFSLVGVVQLAHMALALFTSIRPAHEAWSGTCLARNRPVP